MTPRGLGAYFLPLVAILVPGVALPATITTVDLQFASLPSAQGFGYENQNNSLAEGDVFSIGTALGGEPALLQDSLGAGFQGQGSNLYFLVNALLPSAILVEFDVRARIVEEDNNPASGGGHNHGGFRFGVPGMSVGLGDHALQQGNDPTSEGANPRDTVLLDGTIFHDYLFRMDLITQTFEVLVDGAPRSDGPITIFENRIIFGDATGGTNARAELTRFKVTQTIGSVPVPPTLWLILGALAGLSLLRRSGPGDNR